MGVDLNVNVGNDIDEAFDAKVDAGADVYANVDADVDAEVVADVGADLSDDGNCGDGDANFVDEVKYDWGVVCVLSVAKIPGALMLGCILPSKWQMQLLHSESLM